MKNILSMHRHLEKQKPFYKTMKRLANWYEANPHTKAEIATKIDILHKNFERAQKVLDVKHASEIKPIQQKQIAIKLEAQALGKQHLQEKEDLTLGFAKIEWDLLQGRITDIPEEIKPVHEENWIVRIFEKLFPARI